MKALLALIFAAALACGAEAQTYVGGSVGHGSNSHPTDKGEVPYFQRSIDNSGANVSAFFGQRNGWWGVEAGAFSLPRYEGKGYTADYPAYSLAWKGYLPGPEDNTKTAQITGQARGTALYLRANVYAPETAGLTPYAFGGVALAMNKGRQFGYYNTTDYVEHKESFRNTAPVAGLGVQYRVGARWAARLEYTVSPGLFDNPHFGKRDISFWSMGLLYNF